jgi:uncharacterized membrane protein
MQLVAIAYPDTFTGPTAMEELDPLGQEFMIHPDEMAVLVRDEAMAFRAYTNAVITSDRPAWAMLWWQLFAVLFYVPILGMTVGRELEPLLEKVRRSGLDPLFVDRIAKHAVPGSSFLFVLVEDVAPDAVVSALDAFGGSVLQSELRRGAQQMLQEALHDGSRVA